MRPPIARGATGIVSRIWAGVPVFLLAAILLTFAAGARAADERVVQGTAALQDGLYPLAERLFRETLDSDAGSEEERQATLILFVRSLHSQGKYAEMLEALQVHKGWLRKSDDTAAYTFWRALAMFEMGQREQCLAELMPFEGRFPGSDFTCRVYRLRAGCCAALGRTDEALQWYAKHDADCGAGEAGAQNLLDWGNLLVAEGRLDAAAGVLRRLLEHADGARQVRQGRLILGEALARLARASEADAVLAALCADESADGDLRASAWYRRAALGESTNTAAAATALTQGVAVARSDLARARGEAYLGRLHLANGRWVEGMGRLQRFVGAWPGDPEAGGFQLDIAGALLDHGRYGEAITQYQHYLEAFADTNGQARAYEGRGWALLGTNRFAEAAASFEKAYSQHTGPARREQCLFKVGDAYYQNGQFRLAREAYERLISVFPEGTLKDRARLQAAAAMAAAGDGDDAAVVFVKISHDLQGTPLGEEALYRLGAVLEAQGRWREGGDVYTDVMNRYTNGVFFGRALHGRGMVQYQLFNFEGALADFRNVMARFPGSGEAEQAFYMRGMCEYGLMRDEAAVTTCLEFVDAFPKSRWLGDVRFWLGRYEYNHGEFAEAEAHFLGAADKPASAATAADALLWAGQSAASTKQYLRAVDHYSRLVHDYPDSPRLAEARFYQGDALSELGKFAEAILIFDEIILKYPQSDLVPAAWGRKGDCQFTLGNEDPARYEESIASYRTVVNHPSARPDLVIQANYKIGRCLEKTGRTQEAFDQYYLGVILKYFEDRSKGVWHDPVSKVWFTRAAFTAADILEARKDWRGLVNVLQRVVDAGVPAVDEARERIEKIKAERWRVF
jgi:TolA-binding protein